jgi:hypothetical protein
MAVLERLRLCRALSGLIIDCVSNLTQGVALGSYLARPWRWARITSCPERASYISTGRSPGIMKCVLITPAL